jgi:CIC family chloride channel protein
VVPVPGATAVFAALGGLAVAFPALLGNGKGMAQLAFDGALAAAPLAALVVLKPLATGACLASGAIGGLLTPALATGAALGALTGSAWELLWPGGASAGYAAIGAAAVLATTQRAPLCAIVLVLELTHSALVISLPIMLAVGGAMATARLLERRQTRRGVTGPRARRRPSQD